MAHHRGAGLAFDVCLKPSPLVAERLFSQVVGLSIENGATATMPTQVLPMLPTAGEQRKTPKPKKQPARAEAVRAAKARIIRRRSLRKAAGRPEGLKCQNTVLPG
jgi:hypothetical protein